MDQLLDKLNKRYLQKIGALNVPGLPEFVASSRAQRIQTFYRERLALRTFASSIIQERWRNYRKSKDLTTLRNAKLIHFRKKVAINRIYNFYRTIKVRKVTTSALLV